MATRHLSDPVRRGAGRSRASMPSRRAERPLGPIARAAIVSALALTGMTAAVAQDPPPQGAPGGGGSARMERSKLPKAGDPAPDFTLRSLDGKSETRLSVFRGKRPVVLMFGSYT